MSISDAPMTSSSFFIIDTLYNWENGQKACKSKGAELATVQSWQERMLFFFYLEIQLDSGKIATGNKNWYWFGSKCGSGQTTAGYKGKIHLIYLNDSWCKNKYVRMYPICVIKEYKVTGWFVKIIYRVSQKKWAFLLKEIEPCGFLRCVRIHIKYLNQADQIFRSLFSNVNKHPNISYENIENSDLKL